MGTITVRHKAIIYLLFSLSGFCALIYEILWTKYLTLTFGSTMQAVTTVIATFMGGLAIGSYLIGRASDSNRNLLRTYALLEVGIGIIALLFYPGLSLLDSLHIQLHHFWPNSPAFDTLGHFILSVAVLLPATVLMGGTFPIMCRFFTGKKLGSEIGRLYALNTLGATAGAFSAGFFLIPSLGLSLTGYLAAAINFAIAALCFKLAAPQTEVVPAPVQAESRSHAALGHSGKDRLLLISIALIGAFALGYEILWTRILLLFLGNTSYAFATMLSAYLIGIALGGVIYAKRIKHTTDIRKLYSTLTIAMGLSVLLTAPFYDRLAYLFQSANEAAGQNWGVLSLLYFLIVFAVMFVPTLLSGSLLPAAVALLAPAGGQTGKGVGMVVFNNTLGGVFGSLVAGVILVPLLGIQASFQAVAALNILLGMALFAYFQPTGQALRILPALGVSALIIACAPASWNPLLMNSGIYVYAPQIAKAGGLDRAFSAERILEVIEGRDTTVAIKENDITHTRYFAVNGKTDGGNGNDMATQLLVGQLPLLIHPDPQEVLVIGLGTGITLGGVKEHPAVRIDCAEISPEVVEASAYFEKENRAALQSDKVKLHIADGRALLKTTQKKYDLIISEPSNPWQTGNANLFTADFFQAAAERLKEGGTFTQWVGLYDITTENLRVVCNTFLQAFPEVLTFKVGADLIMIGSAKPLNFDYRAIRNSMQTPQVRAVLAGIGINAPGDLLARHFMMTDRSLHRFSMGAAINTDDRPILEYSAHELLGKINFGTLQKANVYALQQSIEKANVPLVNLGSNAVEIADSLEELIESYTRAGRKADARFLNKKRQDYLREAITSSQVSTTSY